MSHARAATKHSPAELAGAFMLASALLMNLSVAFGQTTVAQHVANAGESAGAEWSEAVDYFCVEGAATPNSADHPVIEPTKIFDNLYAIGRTSTVVYAITTSDGIILIDSGYADQVESVLLPGMAALGLDPADIKYVIVAHGHGDHYGGSTYLQERYGARVVLSAEDWDLMEQPVQPGRTRVPPPRRDLEAVEGGSITLGDIEITPVLIPGHTAGALGVIFPVRDGANTHMAALFGGTILTSSRISDEGLEQYVRSLAHFGDVTAAMGVDMEIQNHPLFDGMADKLERLKLRQPGTAHPFVVAEDGYQRFLNVMASCMSAELARRIPRWPDDRVNLQAVPGETGIWEGRAPASMALPIRNGEVIRSQWDLATNLTVDDVPFKPWARALYNYRRATLGKDDPHTRCKPSGGPRMWHTPYGIEIIDLPETEEIILVGVGGPHSWRTVFMDGRPHPADLEPSWFGHSIGRWEEDTLVIDTVGFNERFWLTRAGMPHTSALHLVERVTRTERYKIVYEATIDDPLTYDETWSGGWTLAWLEDIEPFEYICQENNFDPEHMVGPGE